MKRVKIETELSTYEKDMLRILSTIKTGYFMLVTFNLLLPITEESGLIGLSVFGMPMALVWLIGFLGGVGTLKQKVPILSVFFIRLVQWTVVHFIFGGVKVPQFMFLIAVDLIYLFYLLLVKSKYEFEKEKPDVRKNN